MVTIYDSDEGLSGTLACSYCQRLETMASIDLLCDILHYTLYIYIYMLDIIHIQFVFFSLSSLKIFLILPAPIEMIHLQYFSIFISVL